MSSLQKFKEQTDRFLKDNMYVWRGSKLEYASEYGEKIPCVVYSASYYDYGVMDLKNSIIIVPPICISGTHVIGGKFPLKLLVGDTAKWRLSE